MPILDISRTLEPSLAPWPGDTRFNLTPVLQRSTGASVNLTTINSSAHFGTHIDAPHHFADGVATVEALDLAIYWGLAQVVTIQKLAGELTVADFAGINPALAPRILIHSHASHLDFTQFPTEFVYPSPALADWLGKNGVILYGTDAPSMDHTQSKDLPGHNALLGNGIAILEGLDLSQVADGLYQLVALPLKIAGGDGSPVRAALQPKE